MSVNFEHTVDIARPPADVFDVVADFAQNPRWQRGMVACQWTSDPPAVPGATYRQEARFLGRRIVTTFRVTELEPGRSISIESLQSTFPIQVTRTVLRHGAGSRVIAHVRGQPTGLLKLFSGVVRKSVEQDYARLKAMLESEAKRG